jgi:hypothetical protein
VKRTRDQINRILDEEYAPGTFERATERERMVLVRALQDGWHPDDAAASAFGTEDVVGVEERAALDSKDKDVMDSISLKYISKSPEDMR